MFGEEHDSDSLIRTILGVNEADDSLVLAGEIKQGGFLKLMHASTDSLINGAETAARSTAQMQGSMVTAGQGLAVLVSCVGRKLVMGERVGDEIAAVSAVLGYETTLAGYYSFGEICPFAPGSGCELHNQTMTITHLVET